MEKTHQLLFLLVFFSIQLEEATDVGTIAKVDKSLSKAIMQARTAKKMTQKDVSCVGSGSITIIVCQTINLLMHFIFQLGTAINEKPQVVAEYESGKAIPNPQIISKLERALGTKLPRPGKSKPPPKTGTTGTGAKKPAQSAAAAKGITRGGPPKRR
jgi:putative transcription factor